MPRSKGEARRAAERVCRVVPTGGLGGRPAPWAREESGAPGGRRGPGSAGKRASSAGAQRLRALGVRDARDCVTPGALSPLGAVPSGCAACV